MYPAVIGTLPELAQLRLDFSWRDRWTVQNNTLYPNLRLHYARTACAFISSYVVHHSKSEKPGMENR